MKKADASGARFAVIIGDDEAAAAKQAVETACARNERADAGSARPVARRAHRSDRRRRKRMALRSRRTGTARGAEGLVGQYGTARAWRPRPSRSPSSPGTGLAVVPERADGRGARRFTAQLRQAAAANDTEEGGRSRERADRRSIRLDLRVLGALVAAKAQFDAGDLTTAREAASSGLSSTRGIEEYRGVARLRLAACSRREEVRRRAEGARRASREPTFEALFADLRGDVLLRRGSARRRRAAYEAALARLEPGDDAAREHRPAQARRARGANDAGPRWPRVAWVVLPLALALGGCASMSWNPVRLVHALGTPAARSAADDPEPGAPCASLAGKRRARAQRRLRPRGRRRRAYSRPAPMASSRGSMPQPGKQLWQRRRCRARSPAAWAATASSGRRATARAKCFAFDVDGRSAVERARVERSARGAARSRNDLVVVRSADGRIFGLDARDGQRRWVYQRAAPALAVRSVGRNGRARRRRVRRLRGRQADRALALATADCAGKARCRCRRARPSSSASPT